MTVTVCTGLLWQPAAVAHTVYTTLPDTFAVVKVNGCWMLMAGLGPAEALAPLTPVATTVHSYCTPATVFGLLKMMFAVPPSHTVNTVLLMARVGTGSTVMSTSNGVPLQPLAVGVTV